MRPRLADLAALMRRGASDGVLREVARRSGPAFVRERYRWAGVVRRLLDVIRAGASAA